MSYLVVIEKAESNYSAYVPDLPGCVATGQTPAEARDAIREAIAMHLEALRADGLEIPEPAASAEQVDVQRTA